VLSILFVVAGTVGTVGVGVNVPVHTVELLIGAVGTDVVLCCEVPGAAGAVRGCEGCVCLSVWCCCTHSVVLLLLSLSLSVSVSVSVLSVLSALLSAPTPNLAPHR
jgi:hypothetical protein